MVGPLVSADAAAKLCTTLGRFRLTCQTTFAGRHLRWVESNAHLAARSRLTPS